MHRRFVLAALALVVVPMLAGGRPTTATAVRGVAGGRGHDARDAHHDQDHGCTQEATTGQATARRRCDGTRTQARVDNRLPLSHSRGAEREHERPIDRLRSRGDGRIRATGDKGARRELRAKPRRKS